jgi:hypothetical protein
LVDLGDVKIKETGLIAVNGDNERKSEFKGAKIGRIKIIINIANVLELKFKRSFTLGLFLHGKA